MLVIRRVFAVLAAHLSLDGQSWIGTMPAFIHSG